MDPFSSRLFWNSSSSQENFEKYPWSIDVYEEILRELDICNESMTIRESKRDDVVHGKDGKLKSPLFYLWRCATIIDTSVFEHVLSSMTDLVSVVSPIMLE